MTIDELLAAAGLTANDEIPIWDAEASGEPTKKITAQNLAAAVAALANLVTGVKGNAEANYHHGDVNLTPANIGALPLIGGTITGNLVVHNNTGTQDIALYSNDDGTSGIYIYKPNVYDGKVIIGVDGSGNATFNGTAAGAVGKGKFSNVELLASENIQVGGNFSLGNYNIADFNALRIVNTSHYSSEVFQLVFSNAQTIMANGTTSFSGNRMIIWEFTATTADGKNYTVVRKAQTNLRSDNGYQIEYMNFDADFNVAIYGLR